MRLLILQFVIFGSVTAIFADDLQFFSITTNQATEVKQKFDALERGTVSVENLYENAGKEGCREFVGYYLLHTNELSLQAKLLVARCYSAFGLYPQSVKLTTEYVNVYSNDFHAWNLLGSSYLYLKSSDKAIEAYTNAVRLGDKLSYISLAGAAIQGNQWDVVQNIVHQLLSLKQSKNLSEDGELDLTVILLTYSIKMEQEDIFIKALNGVNAKQVSSRDDLKQVVTMGIQIFKGAAIDKIRQEMESATSSTNSVGSPPR
jgi:tetratricopeptide (TPR) repeat protein